MKKILARGGIEFLAVLFGITGSLFIEDKNNARELNAQLNSSLHALKSELLFNTEQLENFEQAIPKRLPELDFVIKADSLKFLGVDKLDKYFQTSTTNWGTKMNNRVFNSMEASGLIYKIKNDSLRNSILNLYQTIYGRYHYLYDYDLTHIQKFDDIILSSDFLLRDDSNVDSWQWVVDWSKGENIKQFKENRSFRNFLIANRGNKRLMMRVIPRYINETDKTVELISYYLKNVEFCH